MIVANDEVGNAWGLAGEIGIVIGPDPKGINPNVVAVKLNRVQYSVFETRGVDVSHLIPVGDIL